MSDPNTQTGTSRRGDKIEIHFSIQIDDLGRTEEVATLSHRLYELLRSNVEMHIPTGMHLVSNGWERRKDWRRA